VRAAFGGEQLSHRAAVFVELLQEVRERLRQLTGATHVQVLSGTGTHANDAVAGQLRLLGGRGLILISGEFGKRLQDYARGAGLDFETLNILWGESFSSEQVAGRLQGKKWLWGVHCETSTGTLQDLSGLSQICHDAGVTLAMDCVSSLGLVEVDLTGVAFASGVSGKGMGAYPGLALVLGNRPPLDSAGRLPPSLDLARYAATEGVPFTLSSNLLAALGVALRERAESPWMERLVEVSDFLRSRFQNKGFHLLVKREVASPAVLTVVLPEVLDSLLVGEELERRGYLLSYRSQYLLDRNWIQVCLMGEHSVEELQDFPEELERVCGRGSPAWPC
jgi:aspartate aminotransferase-like enzyme